MRGAVESARLEEARPRVPQPRCGHPICPAGLQAEVIEAMKQPEGHLIAAIGRVTDVCAFAVTSRPVSSRTLVTRYHSVTSRLCLMVRRSWAASGVIERGDHHHRGHRGAGLDGAESRRLQQRQGGQRQQTR